MSSPSAHQPLDRALFEQLFKAHFAHLCNFARQYVADADSAKEITQKVFLNLWENRAQIDSRQSIPAYLFTAVRNRCLNHLRDQKKYRSRFLDIELEEEHPWNFAEDQLGLAELEKRIAAALDTLPEKCRQVFEMSRFQQMKYQTIAEELEVSVKTVEAHMSKALKTLRSHLQDYLRILLIFLGF